MNKIYRFDENDLATNPDIKEHELKASKKGRTYCLKLCIKVARSSIGFVAGASLQNVGANYNALPVTAIPCYFYNAPFSSPKRAIVNVLIDLIKYANEESYPLCIMAQIGSLFDEYCQYDLFDNENRVGA